MERKSIAVMYNIYPDEPDTGDYRQEAKTIITSLIEAGFNAWALEVKDDLEGLFNILLRKKEELLCVFNLCESIQNNSWGEIYIASLLDLLSIPYTGSDPFTLGLCLNKARTKDILKANGIPTPLYNVFHMDKKDIVHSLRYPVIVKPLYEDGSSGIDASSVVYDRDALLKRISFIFEYYKEPVIVEEYINGRELNVSIIGNGDRVEILPISEIEYSTLPPEFPRICSFNAKWKVDTPEYINTVPKCPAKLEPEIEERVKTIALKAYTLTGCRDYARVDIRLKDNQLPFVIEVNPNPCMGFDSGFVRSAKAAGIEYKELIPKIAGYCLERSYGETGIKTG